MTRDYKRRGTRKKTQAGTPPWLWLMGGFALGLVAALALYLNLDRERTATQGPQPQTAIQPQSARDADTDELADELADGEASPAKNRAAAHRLRPQGDADYEFYKMLPDFELVVSDSDDDRDKKGTTGKTAAPNNREDKPPAITKPGAYILQAGSFKRFTDADRRKAQLAFQGIESNIQRVVLGNDQIWYRVYVGPTKDLAWLEDRRSTLRRADIDVLMLKVSQ